MSDNEAAMSRGRLVAALTALGGKLSAQGIRAQVFIVGGAAMTLAYSERRMTKDIDAVFEPKSVVYRAVAEVAREQGLPGDWLNDAVKGFMPGPDPDARLVPGIPGIEVSVASPRYLLAMKLMAMRMDEDTADIEILLRECGITTADEAVRLLESLYRNQEPPPRTRFYLEQLLGPMGG